MAELLNEKTYGSLVWEDKTAVIDAVPHVRGRIKNIITGYRQSGNKLRIPLTRSTIQDLEMILGRWPMDCCDGLGDHIFSESERIRREVAEIDLVLTGDAPRRKVAMVQEMRHYQEVAVELLRRKGRYLLADVIGLGKEQPVSEPTPTPSGWVEFGNLKPGDLVLDEFGNPTPVLGVYPQGEKDIYEVIFSDGCSTRCGIKHLWDVYTQTKKKKSRTLSLETILEHGIFTPCGQPRFWVQRQGPAFMEPKDLPLDPYFIGVILGDGCVSEKQTGLQVTIGNLDKDIIGRLPEPSSRRDAPGCQQLGYRMSLLKQVWAAGIKGKSRVKRIPEIYLTSSIEQRWALLHGLMDTDGSCSKNRTIFHTMSEGLAEDVKMLVLSLGGVATVRHYSKGIQVRIQMDTCPFLAERKALQWKVLTRNKRSKRCIVEVRPCGKEECVCIKVPGGLYLTNHFLVTHNTVVAIGGYAAGLGQTIVVCQNHLCRQWAREFEKFLGSGVRIHLQLSGKEAKLPAHDVIILPYTMLAKWADRLVGYPYVIFDEVQELRHEGTAKYAGAKVLSLQASHAIGLSATPVINYGDEIYNVMDIVDPGCLGPRMEFIRTWCIARGGNNLVHDPVALGTFLADDHLLLRRTRQEVKKELPPVTRIIHDVIFNQRMIEQMSKEMLPLARAILAEGSTFNERGQASRQLDLKLRQKTGILKSPFAAEAIADIVGAGEKVLVTAWHRDVYEVIAAHLRGKQIPVWYYTGTETAAQKDASALSFIDHDGPCVLMMSIRSGAGLNGLERVCSTVIHVELDWSGKIIDQATGRLARDGQESHITEVLLVASGGSDPIVANILGIKDGQSSGIVDPTVDRSLETPSPEEEISRGAALAKRVLETLNLQTISCT